MTARQYILRRAYPLFVGIKKILGENKILENRQQLPPPVSIYSLNVELINGDILQFSGLKGKKLMLVNTASNCGYTRQYAELQNLFEQYRQHLLVIAFPANDFKEQEKGNDEEIAKFCHHNFGLSFPLAKKSSVVKGPGQNKVFSWLTNKSLNGWNDRQPVWNFSKYLVNEKGWLMNYFDPAVSPLSQEVRDAIEQ